MGGMFSISHHLYGLVFGPCKSSTCCPSHAKHLMIKYNLHLMVNHVHDSMVHWIPPPFIGGLPSGYVLFTDIMNQLFTFHQVLAMKL